MRTRYRIRLSDQAASDLVAIRRQSARVFGEAAAKRYRLLLDQALRDLRDDPERATSLDRADIRSGLRMFPIRASRERAAQPEGRVGRPRHILFYLVDHEKQVIDVLRVLHDAMDPSLHLEDETE